MSVLRSETSGRIKYRPPSKPFARTESAVIAEFEAENGKSVTPKLPGISLPGTPATAVRPSLSVPMVKSPNARRTSDSELSRSPTLPVAHSHPPSVGHTVSAPALVPAHAPQLGASPRPGHSPRPINSARRTPSPNPIRPGSAQPPASGTVSQSNAGSRRSSISSTNLRASDSGQRKPVVDYGRVAYRSKYDMHTVHVLKEAFDELVNPITKCVDRESFRRAFENHRSDKTEMFSESFFDVLDRDGSNSISFKELLRLMFPLANKRDMEYMMHAAYPVKDNSNKGPTELTPTQKQELTEIFALYDDDDSGEITVEEFRRATSRLGMAKAEIQQLVTEIDADGSGTITLDEFLEGMKKAYLGPAAAAATAPTPVVPSSSKSASPRRMDVDSDSD